LMEIFGRPSMEDNENGSTSKLTQLNKMKTCVSLFRVHRVGWFLRSYLKPEPMREDNTKLSKRKDLLTGGPGLHEADMPTFTGSTN
jgi:hypothetical protein